MSKQIHAPTVQSFPTSLTQFMCARPLHRGYLADIAHKKRQQTKFRWNIICFLRFKFCLPDSFPTTQPCQKWSLTKTASIFWRQGCWKDRQASPRSRNPLHLRLQDFYAEYLKGDPKSEGDYRTQRFVELALKDGICEKKAKRALNSGKVFPTSFIFVQLAQCSIFSQCNFHRQIPVEFTFLDIHEHKGLNEDMASPAFLSWWCVLLPPHACKQQRAARFSVMSTRSSLWHGCLRLHSTHQQHWKWRQG